MPKTKRSKSTPNVCHCPFARAAPIHHDALLRVEHDLDALLSLVELAVTWHELDYANESVVRPCDWADFAAIHTWRNAASVDRIFDLAVDISRGQESRSPRSPTAAIAAGEPSLVTISPDPMDLAMAIIRLEHQVGAIADFVGIDLSVGEDHR
jgi:hypothetical protein